MSLSNPLSDGGMMHIRRCVSSVIVCATVFAIGAIGCANYALAGDSAKSTGFRFVDGDGYRDLLFNDQPIYRHMTKYDPADRENTNKPFHHLYGMHGEGFMTKGPGGFETHHRGLFLGFTTPAGNFWACT